MSIPSSDCDKRLAFFFYFEDKMFAYLFRGDGIRLVGIFSYHHMMETVTCFFAVLH